MIDLNTIQCKPLSNVLSETKCLFKLHSEVFLSSCLRLLEALLKIRIYTGEFFATRFRRVFTRENLSCRVVTHTRLDSLAAIVFGKNRCRVSNTLICYADYILRDSIQESFSLVITYTRSISTSRASQGKAVRVNS